MTTLHIKLVAVPQNNYLLSNLKKKKTGNKFEYIIGKCTALILNTDLAANTLKSGLIVLFY